KSVALTAAAALAAFGGAFAAGYLTAPSSHAATPTLGAARPSTAPLALPHLSQAVPLAAFHPAPAPVVRTVSGPVPAKPQPAKPKPAKPRRARRKPRPAPQLRVHRSRPARPARPARPQSPVDITGSG